MHIRNKIVQLNQEVSDLKDKYQRLVEQTRKKKFK
jgi:hypothetical protein